MTTPPFVLHRGSCHCKSVQFEFDAPSDLVQTTCNCSICTMKQNAHAIVPMSRFRLLQGEEMLTLYTFNTHQAKHLFCKKCGVQAFYIPRSNPDGYAVTLSCVDPASISSITTNTFDGQNWETSFEASNMASYSKEYNIMPTLPARAGILTVSGTKLKFDAPSRTCVTFSYCSGWERASKLLYAPVPSGQGMVFLAEEECAGDPVFTADVGKTFGNEIVKGNRAIVRSFILAKYTHYPVKGIISACRGESALVSNTTNNREWLSSSSGSSFYEGNLSINWFDSLPSGDVSVGDI